jgi:hypothetical protein
MREPRITFLVAADERVEEPWVGQGVSTHRVRDTILSLFGRISPPPEGCYVSRLSSLDYICSVRILKSIYDSHILLVFTIVITLYSRLFKTCWTSLFFAGRISSPRVVSQLNCNSIRDPSLVYRTCSDQLPPREDVGYEFCFGSRRLLDCQFLAYSDLPVFMHISNPDWSDAGSAIIVYSCS